jgi:hypothetical protein
MAEAEENLISIKEILEVSKNFLTLEIKSFENL